MNSNQFEFERQIAAIFKSQTRRLSRRRVAAICRVVCRICVHRLQGDITRTIDLGTPEIDEISEKKQTERADNKKCA